MSYNPPSVEKWNMGLWNTIPSKFKMGVSIQGLMLHN